MAVVEGFQLVSTHTPGHDGVVCYTLFHLRTLGFLSRVAWFRCQSVITFRRLIQALNRCLRSYISHLGCMSWHSKYLSLSLTGWARGLPCTILGLLIGQRISKGNISHSLFRLERLYMGHRQLRPNNVLDVTLRSPIGYHLGPHTPGVIFCLTDDTFRTQNAPLPAVQRLAGSRSNLDDNLPCFMIHQNKTPRKGLMRGVSETIVSLVECFAQVVCVTSQIAPLVTRIRNWDYTSRRYI